MNGSKVSWWIVGCCCADVGLRVRSPKKAFVATNGIARAQQGAKAQSVFENGWLPKHGGTIRGK